MWVWVALLLALAAWAVLAWRHWRRHHDQLNVRRVLRAQSRPHVVESPLLRMSATQLAHRIRTRATTSVEAVEVHIARIRSINGALNALVYDRFALALAEAAQCDAAVARGDANLPPFHGVPCSIKEAFAVTGCPHTGGLKARRGVVAQADADCVAAYRAGGFIVLGVSNVSELCMWQESCNTLYGRTSCAYSNDHTCGGSSGGEGALIGACGVPVGLGSDIGGSIRMPSFFNGIFGHKCTAGLISNVGQYPAPNPSSLANRFLCSGPMARHAEDLAPLVELLSGSPLPRVRAAQTVRVFSCESIGIWGLSPSTELVQAQRRAASALEHAWGRPVTVLPPPRAMRRAIEIWATLLQEAEDQSFAERLYGPNGGGTWRSVKELLLWTVGASEHTLPALALALIEGVTHLMATDAQVRALNADADALRAELETLLGKDGVLLFPSFPTVAPRHSRALLLPIQWIYTAIFNTLYLPVTQVPLGLNGDGLPLGVQVVGARGSDALTIATAVELERLCGGWQPPLR